MATIPTVTVAISVTAVAALTVAHGGALAIGDKTAARMPSQMTRTFASTGVSLLPWIIAADIAVQTPAALKTAPDVAVAAHNEC